MRVALPPRVKLTGAFFMYVTHYLSHPFDTIDARRLVERAYRSYQSRYPAAQIALVWESDNLASVEFGVRGFRFQGRVTLRPGTLELGLQLPMVFRVFRDRAVQRIDEEARRWVLLAHQDQLPADGPDAGRATP
jgi:hypothetical protein